MRDLVVDGCDGELAGDLFLPRTDAPVPCVVTLVPYNKDGVAGVTSWQGNHALAAAGYASLLVDSRGTGASPGAARPPFHPDEGRDGAAVVEWAARQPWCDGNVGMWGVSYAATTALCTAALRPPSLKAVAFVMGMLDPERDFVHPEGRQGCIASLGMWGLSTLAQHLTPPLRDGASNAAEARWRDRVRHGRPFILDLLRDGPGDPSWRGRAVDVRRIATPTFCVAGWRDMCCDATIRAYEQIRAPKQLLVGPWMHTLPDDSPFEAVGFLSLLGAWWDRWLRPDVAAAAPERPVTIYLQNRRRWLGLRDWPGNAARMRLDASADARLVKDFPPLKGELEQPVDPAVGVRGGLWSVPTHGFGLPRDQHEDDSRSLTFTSDPIERPVAICGRPAVTVALAARATDGPLVARLTHVKANGSSVLITSGLATAAAATSQRIRLIPTAYEIPAGDRLRLVIAGADFPRLWPARAPGVIRCRTPGTFVDLPVLRAADDLPEAALPPADADGAAPSLVLRADPLYTVTSDPLRDATTVAVGSHLVLTTPLEEHRLDIHAFTTASVAAADPGAARVTGRSTTHVTTSRGRYVIRAELDLTAERAVVGGEVTRDGRRELRRRWTIDRAAE